jgi:predicted DNA-binding transcriptional regulator AlpA
VIQRRMKAGDFPLPLQLSPNRVAWLRCEVMNWKGSLSRARIAA